MDVDACMGYRANILYIYVWTLLDVSLKATHTQVIGILPLYRNTGPHIHHTTPTMTCVTCGLVRDFSWGIGFYEGVAIMASSPLYTLFLCIVPGWWKEEGRKGWREGWIVYTYLCLDTLSLMSFCMPTKKDYIICTINKYPYIWPWRERGPGEDSIDIARGKQDRPHAWGMKSAPLSQQLLL